MNFNQQENKNDSIQTINLIQENESQMKNEFMSKIKMSKESLSNYNEEIEKDNASEEPKIKLLSDADKIINSAPMQTFHENKLNFHDQNQE